MELSELRVFLKVAAERSFSRAAMKLHRTQPAVSQAVRRLEESVGERLFDRATKDASLTEAGRLLRDYAERLLRLSEEAEGAVKDLRDLRRGRVLIGANEASVHAVLPLIARFRQVHPLVHVDVRRIRARQLGAEVAQGSLDFGVLTFQPAEPRLGSLVLGHDELVMLVHPHCSCSRASVQELAEIVEKAPRDVETTVLVYRPREMPAGWELTNVYDAATRLRRARVQLDVDGAEAARFGGFTSGQTFLYDGDGRLRFAGGVTSLRGHAGLNRGRADVIRIANDRAGNGSHPVFGCAITTRTKRGEPR